MARLPRYYIKNQPQHIIQRGLDDQDVFHHEDDYQQYLQCLHAAAESNKLKVHAYVLMPNHIHLLATPTTEQAVPKTLQSLGRNYVQYFNDNYWHTGTLWAGRYRATILDSKEYLLKCSRYIELNPVRHALAKNPKDYRWSSYAHNAMGKANDIINPHKEYLLLGASEKDRSKAYRELFKKRISDEELDTIRDATNKGWALGSSKFASKIEKIGGRRATPLPKGRPRLYG